MLRKAVAEKRFNYCFFIYSKGIDIRKIRCYKTGKQSFVGAHEKVRR